MMFLLNPELQNSSQDQVLFIMVSFVLFYNSRDLDPICKEIERKNATSMLLALLLLRHHKLIA